MGQWPGRMGWRWRLVESRWRGRRLDKPPELWWRRFMGQSVVSEALIRGCAPPDGPILFLPAELVAEQRGRAFVAIVRSKDEENAE